MGPLDDMCHDIRPPNEGVDIAAVHERLETPARAAQCLAGRRHHVNDTPENAGFKVTRLTKPGTRRSAWLRNKNQPLLAALLLFRIPACSFGQSNDVYRTCVIVSDSDAFPSCLARRLTLMLASWPSHRSSLP